MHTVALAIHAAALACAPDPVVDGFDPRLEGASGVPVDARLLIGATTGELEVVVTDGITVFEGRVVGVEAAASWFAWIPDAPLPPLTPITATVSALDPAMGEDTVSFTTGDAVATAGAAELEDLQLGAWSPAEDTGDCDVFSERSLAATVRVEAGPLSWLGLRDGSGVVHVLVPADAPGTIRIEDMQVDRVGGAFERDCFVPVLASASGEEVAGAELCVVPAGTGCAERRAAGPLAEGCASTGAAAPGAWVLLLALLLRRRAC